MRVGKNLADQRAGALFVRGIHEGEQVAHRDRDDAGRFELRRRTAHRVLVERLEHGARVIDAAADLAGQTLRRDRRRLLEEIIEHIAVARLALGLLDGAKAAVDEEADFGAAHFQQRIGGDRGAVGEKFDCRQIDAARGKVADAAHDAERGIFRRGRDLLDGERAVGNVEQHQVGVGAADIDAQSICLAAIARTLFPQLARAIRRGTRAPPGLGSPAGIFYSRWRHRRKCVNPGIDMPRLRDFGLALFLAHCSPCAASRARQEPYPTRVVKIVVPSLPGSTTDILARLVADQLSQKWGKPVIVENVPGAAMNIGSEYVSRAAPDGYTLMICPPSPVTIQHLLYHDLKYEPTKFVPIALLAKIANVLTVRKDLPANTIQELIAYAKANPGKLTFASQGVGSTAHLSASELEMLGGIKMVHVPYRGAQPALNDVLAGHVDMFFDTLTTSVPLYRDGKVKILGVASAERSEDVPEIPTIAEQGLPGFRSITWFALVAPPGHAAALADKINRDVAEILQKPEIAEKFKRCGSSRWAAPRGRGEILRRRDQLWGRVIKRKITSRCGAVQRSNACACRGFAMRNLASCAHGARRRYAAHPESWLERKSPLPRPKRGIRHQRRARAEIPDAAKPFGFKNG